MSCLYFWTLMASAHTFAPYSRIEWMVVTRSRLIACGLGPRVIVISWLSWHILIDAFSVAFRRYSANVSFVSIVTPRCTAEGFVSMTWSPTRIGGIVLIRLPDSIAISVFARASWTLCSPSSGRLYASWFPFLPEPCPTRCLHLRSMFQTRLMLLSLIGFIFIFIFPWNHTVP